MKANDRLILGAIAAGLWTLVLLQLTAHGIAHADIDPDFGVKVNAYDVRGLDRFVIRTVERCAVAEGGHIGCG